MTRALSVFAGLALASCGSMKAATPNGAACTTDRDCRTGGAKGAICYFGHCVDDHAPLEVQVEIRPATSTGLPAQQFAPINLQTISGVQDFTLTPQQIAGAVTDARPGVPQLPARYAAISSVPVIPGRPIRVSGETDAQGNLSFLVPGGDYGFFAALADGLRAPPATISAGGTVNIPVGAQLFTVQGTIQDTAGAGAACVEATVFACDRDDAGTPRCRSRGSALSAASVTGANGSYAASFDASWLTTGIPLFLRVAPSAAGACTPPSGPVRYVALQGLTTTPATQPLITYAYPALTLTPITITGGAKNAVADADVYLVATSLGGVPAQEEATFEVQARTGPQGIAVDTLGNPPALLPGDYAVIVAPPSGDDLEVARAPLTVTSTATPLSLQLAAQPSLSGQVVRSKDSLALAGVGVTAERVDDGVQPALPARVFKAVTDANGNFTMRVDGSPKGYFVTFDAPASSTAKYPRWSIGIPAMGETDLALASPVALPEAQALSGTVYGASPGTTPAALPDARLDVYWIEPGDPSANPPVPPSAILIGSAVSGADGAYDVLLPKASSGTGAP